MAVALQRRHQCGQYRRQVFAKEMVSRLPERFQQLNHDVYQRAGLAHLLGSGLAPA